MAQPEYTVEEKPSSRTEHRWSLPDGTLHREDGPAYARYFRDDLEVECWVQNGQFNRPDGGPTGIAFGRPPGGSITSDLPRTELWLTGEFHTHPSNRTNVRHRTDGPAVVGYFADGSIRSQEWFANGRRHKPDGPAIVEFNEDGTLIREEFYIDGSRSPQAAAYFFDNGSIKREIWCLAELHRLDGPAWSEWHSDGSLKSVEYFVGGLMSRADGPAAVEYFSTEDAGEVGNRPYLEQWRINDRLHRSDGPAVTIWHPNGTVAEKQWWTEGKRRIEGGPALERWSSEGEPAGEVTWSEGTGDEAPQGYFRQAHGTFDWRDDVLEPEIESFALRRWHRWMLSLEPEPDDAPFTESSWLTSATEPELQSRLCYYPGGDQMVDRILEWRSPSSDLRGVVEITLAFVKFLRSHQEPGDRADRLDASLRGTVTVLDSPPKVEEDEWDARDFIEPIQDKAWTPTILHESIYNASGNCFEPIYWITAPLHGHDVTPWWDMWRTNFVAVVGQNGVRVGPLS